MDQQLKRRFFNRSRRITAAPVLASDAQPTRPA
jgi:hypothetical protein